VNLTCTICLGTVRAMSRLCGLHVPLLTPYDADGRVAERALEDLACSVLDDGAVGVVALGTTAEAAALDSSEKVAIVEVCARVCGERGASLIVGAGTNNTRTTEKALAELTRWPDITAALVPVPYYTRPSPDGVIAHFTRLSRTSPLPLVVYHVPYRTACSLDASVLRELGRLPGVVGVKLATGGVDHHVVDLISELPPDFEVLAGDDAFLSPLLALGAGGGILASAHLATSRYAALVNAWRDGDVTRARALGRELAKLSAAAFAEPNPTVIKGVLHELGRIPTPDVRLPLLRARRGSIETALRLATTASDAL
jgi:4-hydroxy-tetrahydrodipicolinate synthase